LRARIAAPKWPPSGRNEAAGLNGLESFEKLRSRPLKVSFGFPDRVSQPKRGFPSPKLLGLFENRVSRVLADGFVLSSADRRGFGFGRSFGFLACARQSIGGFLRPLTLPGRPGSGRRRRSAPARIG
jgi:hypothetical protein